MYFFNQKRLLAILLALISSFAAFSQENRVISDTSALQQDSVAIMSDTTVVAPDSIPASAARSRSSNSIESKLTYTSTGYLKRDVIKKEVVLVSGAKVNYGDIQITADSIYINMQKNLLYAVGRKDTTGKIVGKPVYTEKSQVLEADNFVYNFKTKKGRAKNIVTKQDEGLLHSQVTKLLEDGTSNISKSTYSTCDAEIPHFYINLPKARIYPGKKIVSGPGNLVLEGIPLPLFLPFGYFPVQTKKAASGILIPRIGQENTRGYSLTDGGYYFAISDYFDLGIRGNVYSGGTWMATAQSNYRKLYKYSGNFSFSFADNKSGHKGLKDWSENKNYRIGWTYTQDAKASPGSRFSASVNMSSSGFDRNNSYVVSEHVTTQRLSSVSYSKTWDGTPFNFSASMNHSQDVRLKTVNLNLPKANFNMSRIFPLKGKNSMGTSKWWQELQFSYSASLDNQVSTYDSLLFTKNVWKNVRSGFRHEAPLSLQIRPFRNFSISPAVTYTGVVFSQKVTHVFNPFYVDPESGKIKPTIIRDTLRGAFYAQAFNPSISASFNPQIFGTFEFINPNSRVQSIRHVIKPSVGFSYVPSLSGVSTISYEQVQVDTLGRLQEFSLYEGNLYQPPSLSSRSGNVSFSLTNILEAKVFAKNDTTGKPKKVKIIDNFGITTAYNIFADSMKWSQVQMQGRTSLAENIGINASAGFSLYGIDDKGRVVKTFALQQNGKLMRLTNFSASIDLSVSDLLKGDKDKNKTASTPNALTGGVQQTNPTGNSDLSQNNTGAGIRDAYGYPVFNVPWTMNLSYSMNYYKQAFKSVVSQALILSGNVTVTKKMQMTYTTGYDFNAKEITMTQIGITRDLHCWEMNFNWVPNGTMKMWNFTIRVKATVLGDLKYERRKDYHDMY